MKNIAFFGRNIQMRPALIAVVTLWLAYCILSILAPSSGAEERYHITSLRLAFLQGTFFIPLLVIWLAAMFAIVRFVRYTSIIEGSPESAGFKKLCYGLRALFLVLIIPSFINLVAMYNPESGAADKYTSIVRNYSTIVLYLFAFWQLWHGSKILNITSTKEQGSAPKARIIAFVITATLSAVYVWLIFQNPFRTSSTDLLVKPAYYLPDWLIVLTIIIPYIAIWTMGSVAVINLIAFAKRVPGIMYRRAILWVSWGLSLIVLLLVALQLLNQLGGYFGRAKLETLLGIIYLLLLVMVVTYLFIARGARALTALEEV